MKKDLSKKISYWTGVVCLGCMLGFSVQIVNGWVEPTLSPPGGNLVGPITGSDTAQYKKGALGVGMTIQPVEKLEVGGNVKMQNTTGTGRGQIIFNSANPGAFGSSTAGYNTINTLSPKGYIGIYGGPNWTDGGAVEVSGKNYDGTNTDMGVVAVTFVGGTDGHHGGFYVADSTDLADGLPFAVNRHGAVNSDFPWLVNMPRSKVVAGGIQLGLSDREGRGQIVFNSAAPGAFGSSTAGYNTINTKRNDGYIGIYGGPNWADGGAVEVSGKSYAQGPDGDTGVVALTFVGGTDGKHNGFYVVDSTDLNDLPLAIKRVRNVGNPTVWRADMRRTDLVVQRDIYATSFLRNSDERLKNNVSEISNALEKIDQLRGVSFNWKEGGKESVGFLAQEVEKVFPELVGVDSVSGYKSLEYGNLTAPLVEAVKELKKRDEENKQRIDKLESVVEELKAEIEKLKLN